MSASPKLAKFIGKKKTTRSNAMNFIYAYIKEHNLQDPENKQYFLPDKKMSKIFGKKRMRINQGIQQGLTAHMQK